MIIATTTTKCQFSAPVYYYGSNNTDFEYSVLNCTSTMAQNQVIPTFTYGELLTNYWLFIIIIGCIVGFIFNKFVLRK